MKEDLEKTIHATGSIQEKRGAWGLGRENFGVEVFYLLPFHVYVRVGSVVKVGLAPSNVIPKLLTDFKKLRKFNYSYLFPVE